MCTITLEYDKKSALARRKLAALLATGLFVRKDDTAIVDKVDNDLTSQDVEAHRKFNEEFLYASKINSAKAFAKHLK